MPVEEITQAKARFARELDALKDNLIELARLAAAAMEQSVQAVLTRDGDLARRVIAGDTAVNNLEEAIDEACDWARRVFGN